MTSQNRFIRGRKPLALATAALITSFTGAVADITVKGSDTMVILAQKWAEVYMGAHPGSKIQVTGGGTGTGFAALQNQSTDLCNVGQVWLPTASYEEMLHWALPTPAYTEYEQFEQELKKRGEWERFGRFVRGGHWRGFLAKYPEANILHKKMLWVSERLQKLTGMLPDNSAEIRQAREHLYAGQCNCPYWHGVFGGLYLPHLRKAVYGELIKAEALLGRIESRHGVTIETPDIHADGHDDVLISSDSLSAWISGCSRSRTDSGTWSPSSPSYGPGQKQGVPPFMAGG